MVACSSKASRVRFAGVVLFVSLICGSDKVMAVEDLREIFHFHVEGVIAVVRRGQIRIYFWTFVKPFACIVRITLNR